MKKKTKQNKFEKFSFTFFKITVVVAIMGQLVVQIFNSSLNVQMQKIQREVETLEREVSSLTIEKNNVVSFADLNEVAMKNGYSHTSNSPVASR